MNSFQGGCCFEQSYCNNHCDYIYKDIKPFFSSSFNHCYCRYINFFLNIILPVNGLLGGTKLQLQGCYTSIWGAFRGFNQYCICNYYGGVWLLLIVTTTFIRNTKRSVRDLFSSRTTCLRCHLYCICDSYASLFFYLLLFPMCL